MNLLVVCAAGLNIPFVFCTALVMMILILVLSGPGPNDPQ